MERLARIKRQRKTTAIVRVILAIIITVAIAWFFFATLAGAVDNGIDNQNVMLCKSAEKSGNVEWLDKCSRYYETGEYEYLRGL